MNIWQLNQAISNFLETSEYPDDSVNGLQVESKNTSIKKIALAVDSGLSIIQEAVDRKADLLIVHHGLFWGQSSSITGLLAKKIDTLLANSCSLIAQHLPLDGNPFVGNNYELARLFELEEIIGFGPLSGNKYYGCAGKFFEPKKIEHFLSKANQLVGFDYKLSLPFGKSEIFTCAIVSGSGSFAMEQCYHKYDLFISGEPKQSVFHDSKDNQQNALFLGHYATETIGIKALGKWINDNYQIETFFIDQPTHI